MMDALLVVLAIIAIAALRILLRSLPRYYFSIQDIVTVRSAEINLAGFAIRFGFLFLCSLIVAVLYAGNVYRVVQFSLTVSFLLIWPFLLQHVIYRDTLPARKHDLKPYPVSYIIKYLCVYIVYAALCVVFSLFAVPVYRFLSAKPTDLYFVFLHQYLTLDPFLQSLISNAIAMVVLGAAGIALRRIYRLILRRFFH